MMRPAAVKRETVAPFNLAWLGLQDMSQRGEAEMRALKDGRLVGELMNIISMLRLASRRKIMLE